MAVTHATRTHSFRPGRTLAIAGIALALAMGAFAARAAVSLAQGPESWLPESPVAAVPTPSATPDPTLTPDPSPVPTAVPTPGTTDPMAAPSTAPTPAYLSPRPASAPVNDPFAIRTHPSRSTPASRPNGRSTRYAAPLRCSIIAAPTFAATGHGLLLFTPVPICAITMTAS